MMVLRSKRSTASRGGPVAQNTVPANDELTGSRFIDGVPYDQYAAMAGLQIVQGRKFVDGPRRDDVRLGVARTAES